MATPQHAESTPATSLERGSPSTAGAATSRTFPENGSSGVTLPSIQTLMARTSSSRDHGSTGHGDGGYRFSPPEQHQQPQYMRKRANEPMQDHHAHHGRQSDSRDDSGSPPANKRRRVDIEPERNGSTGPDSSRHSLHHQRSAPSMSQQQQQHSSTMRHPHEHPRIQPAPTGPASMPPGLKQEQTSPPAVLVQSPGTPSTVNNPTPTSGTMAISEPPSSFSRRISASAVSPSTQRPTPRKLPPSRLNFQSSSSSSSQGQGHALHGSLAAVPPPSIRSAPPVPVNRDGQGPMQMQMQSRLAPLAAASGGAGQSGQGASKEGGWLTSRPSLQSHSSQPSQSQKTSSHSHSRSNSQHIQLPYPAPPDSATPRASNFPRDRDGWPTMPTPTSLRLGSRSIVPQAAAQSPGPGSTFRGPNTPSAARHGPTASAQASGHGSGTTPSVPRFPPTTPGLGPGIARTPSVLSPIPPLGHSSNQNARAEINDKAKFMSKISDIAEEVERRLREKDREIHGLKVAIGELMKDVRSLKSALGSSSRPDGDGDVTMAPAARTGGDMDVDPRPTASVANGSAARIAKISATALPQIPAIPKTPSLIPNGNTAREASPSPPSASSDESKRVDAARPKDPEKEHNRMLEDESSKPSPREVGAD